jgi:hypothetical protein
MSVTATHYALAAAPEGRVRSIATLGQWDITAPCGEALRVVAANIHPDAVPGQVSDVYVFNRKQLNDAERLEGLLGGAA